MNRTIQRHIVLVGFLLTGFVCCGVRAAAAADEAQTGPSTVRIDARVVGHPISKYIYGQFIEHLGRCIYGGIWAEMLEDRKFYFPITPHYAPYGAGRNMAQGVLLPVVAASPWEMLGPDGSVAMVTDDSFVGRATPVIQPGSGIRQNDLGLIEGKDYVGHIWLKADRPGASVELSLVWGDGPADRQTVGIDPVAQQYTKYAMRFRSGAGTDAGRLAIAVAGAPCAVGTVSLMPADNVRGMRADTLKLLKELGAPMYRWPGGNFVSGYDWRDGIGDRDRRPPRRNPAWTGVEHNDFGVDEFIDFCRELDAEPLIAVNTGFGDAFSAALEVEYCNGGAETLGGRWRIANGHAAPYDVTWWCVGNEMFGPWQLGFMQLKHYTLKHNQTAAAMRKADPSIKLIGVGALGHLNPRHDPGEKRGWSRGMLEQCADHMDLISEHFYCGTKDDLREHVRQIPDRIRQKADGHRQLRAEIPGVKDKDIRIAMDEWNLWHRPYYYGELGCRYRLRDALGIAAGLHEYYRQSDLIEMAHYAQTVNVIGCIKTTKTAAFFATTGLPLKLYRHHFGTLPVRVAAGEPLDVMAALTEDKEALTIGVVNPTLESVAVPLAIDGASLRGGGTRWQIAGDDPMRYNEPGKPAAVKIDRTQLDGAVERISVAPCSITLYRLELD